MMPIKTVYIVFPTGGGGNHLGNMLSLTPGFRPRFKYDKDYETEMLSKYRDNKVLSDNIDWQSTAAHFHINDLDCENNQPGIKIICNHMNIFITMAIHSSEWELTESDIIVLFNYPEPDSFMYRRITEPVWFGRHDPPSNYDLSFIKNLTNANVKQFDITQYASENGFIYAKKFFKDNFNIILSDSCAEMHSIWWDNIHKKIHGKSSTKTVLDINRP